MGHSNKLQAPFARQTAVLIDMESGLKVNFNRVLSGLGALC